MPDCNCFLNFPDNLTESQLDRLRELLKESEECELLKLVQSRTCANPNCPDPRFTVDLRKDLRSKRKKFCGRARCYQAVKRARKREQSSFQALPVAH